MSYSLTHNIYGKSRVRVSKIKRPRKAPASEELHEFVEATVEVLLQGDFEASFQGDNRLVVATDTCKNTIYVLAKDDPFETLESFGTTVANHFLKQYEHVTSAHVTLAGHSWHRLLDSQYAFVGGSGEIPTAIVIAEREKPLSVTAGLKDLMIAKTTGSGFSDFHQDGFRTLPDATDRIMATQLSASWMYGTGNIDYKESRHKIRMAPFQRFIDHYSRSVQETLYRMAAGALDACMEATSVTITMPNKHHLLFDLSRFDRENDNEIFVVTDEPHGLISGTVSRS